jgi:hypothetical protein
MKISKSVSLDLDVMKAIETEAELKQKSFSSVVNEAVRKGIQI